MEEEKIDNISEMIISSYKRYIDLALLDEINIDSITELNKKIHVFDIETNYYLENSFEIYFPDEWHMDLFIKAMNSFFDKMFSKYIDLDILRIVGFIEQSQAFDISSKFIKYESVHEINNRFICEESLKSIKKIFPNYNDNLLINDILKIKKFYNLDKEILFESLNSSIDGIEHKPLFDYVYGNIDVTRLERDILRGIINHEMKMTSFNICFPEKLINSAFKLSISNKNNSIFEWNFINNPNKKIREKYLDFLISEELNVCNSCEEDKYSLIEFVLTSKFLTFEELNKFVLAIKSTDSFKSYDDYFDVNLLCIECNLNDDEKKIILEIIEDKYNSLIKGKTYKKNNNKKFRGKFFKERMHSYNSKIYENKCSKNTSFNIKSNNYINISKSNPAAVLKTEKQNILSKELNQAKTRIISRQIMKMTKEPLKSLLIKDINLESKMSNFINSKYFDSLIGITLYSVSKKINFNKESLENAKNEISEEFKIESIATLGNELLKIVDDSIKNMLEKIKTKKEIKNSPKIKKLSDGKKTDALSIKIKNALVKK